MLFVTKRKGTMTYKRVTKADRILIHRWGQEGYGLREIARRLGRAASSITREVLRNSGKRGYRPRQATNMACERAKRPGSRRFTEALKITVETQLRAGWTPDMISGRARLEQCPNVCKETIYQYVYADARNGGTLWKSLPRSKRKRHRRCPRQEGRGRGRIPNQRSIDTRPVVVETRLSVGHWEGDLINGAAHTGNLVTLVERKTRFTLVGHTVSKDAEEVTAKICALLGSLPQSLRKTVTFDNGKEFAHHEEMARTLSMDVFFAHPYHSWERGTNENTNGLVRRLHPKKSSFAAIGEPELNRIAAFVNDRPRK